MSTALCCSQDEAEKLKQERLEQYAAKKKKSKLIALYVCVSVIFVKSIIIISVLILRAHILVVEYEYSLIIIMNLTRVLSCSVSGYM